MELNQLEIPLRMSLALLAKMERLTNDLQGPASKINHSMSQLSKNSLKNAIKRYLKNYHREYEKILK